MLSIPDTLWETLLNEFARHPRDVERVAYLDGVRYTAGDGKVHGVITTVVLPDAVLSPGNYRVPADAVLQAGRHMFENGLVRLAQVHTHGNDTVNHSSVDDRLAYTRRDGGISIVLPYHARRRPQPLDGGVHVLHGYVWRCLNDHEAATEIRLVPSLRDFRSLPLKRGIWGWLPWNR